MKKSCNIDQLLILDRLMSSVLTNSDDKIYHVNGPGGTDKTYLYNCLIQFLRANDKQNITVAWTGIASILLPGGTTSHRVFKLPIKVDTYSKCYFKNAKDKIHLNETDVIIWDEASILPSRAVEMVDKLLQDLCNDSRSFGDKFVIFGGDFCQV